MDFDFSKLADKIKAAIDDLITLSVTTVTGDIKATYTGKGWEVKPEATTNATIKASTTIKVDGDITSVVPSDASGKPDEAWLAFHQKVVQNAIESRTALLNSLLSLLKQH